MSVSKDVPRPVDAPVRPITDVTPSLAAAVMLSLATASFACFLLGALDRQDWLGQAVMMCVTALATFFFVWGAQNKDTMWVGSVMAGAQTAVVVVFVDFVFLAVRGELHTSSSISKPLGTEIFSLLILLIVAALLGGMAGVAAIPVLLPAARAQESSALDRTERALVPSALGVLLIAGALALLPPREIVSVIVTTSAALIAFGTLAFVAMRDARRLGWLKRLYQGKLIHYQLDATTKESAPPFGGYVEKRATHRVVYMPPPLPPPADAYRDKPNPPPLEERVVVARVPAKVQEAVRPIRARLALAMLAILGTLVVLFLRLQAK